MRVGINFAEALRQSERTFARSHRFNFGDLIWKSLLPVAANRNIGIPACAPSGFPTRLLQRPQPLHQRSKTPLGTQTEKSVFRGRGQTIRRCVMAFRPVPAAPICRGRAKPEFGLGAKPGVPRRIRWPEWRNQGGR